MRAKQLLKDATPLFAQRLELYVLKTVCSCMEDCMFLNVTI